MPADSAASHASMMVRMTLALSTGWPPRDDVPCVIEYRDAPASIKIADGGLHK